MVVACCWSGTERSGLSVSLLVFRCWCFSTAAAISVDWLNSSVPLLMLMLLLLLLIDPLLLLLLSIRLLLLLVVLKGSIQRNYELIQIVNPDLISSLLSAKSKNNRSSAPLTNIGCYSLFCLLFSVCPYIIKLVRSIILIVKACSGPRWNTRYIWNKKLFPWMFLIAHSDIFVL